MQEVYYTLPEKLNEVVKKSPDKIALQIKKPGGYEQHTYADLYNNVKSVAQSLIALGIQKNDRIAIVLENRPEWVFIYFGVLFAEAIAVPLDPQATIDDLKYFLQDSESKVVFTSLKFKPLVCTAMQTVKTLQNTVLLDADNSEKTKQILFFPDFLKHQAKLPENLKTLPSDIASILYTSGTTGKPKGVMLTHQNFYANFRSMEKSKILALEHNMLSILPLHHSFPFMTTLIIPIFSQNKITYTPSLKQEEITKCMRETNVTFLVGVPQLFYMFHQTIRNKINSIPFFARIPLLGLINFFHKLRQLTNINLNKFLLAKIHTAFGHQLKYFVSGGAKLDKSIELFLTKIGFTIIQGYGLTETAPIVTFNPTDKIKIGSVGKTVPDVSIEIIEPDASGIGEIAICGPNVMRGYYKCKSETQKVLKGNWFYSGDLGYLDQQDYLFLTGRKKELIILASGKNISPEEVENYYSKSRYIKELCVLPIGSGEKEKLAAVIVPNFEYFTTTGEININNKIKLELDILAQNYQPYKRIMRFIITKKELPKTHLGKLKRHEIQEKYLDELTNIKPKIQQEEEIKEADYEILASPTYRAVSAIIEKQLNHPIHLNDHLGLDLGLDSLSRIELIATLEKQLNLEISELLTTKVSTIKDLIFTLDQLITTQTSKAALPIKTSIKATSWQNILKTDPEKIVTDKIVLTLKWFAKAANILFYSGLYIIAKIMWHIKIYGIENLPKNNSFILCPNHTSYLDAFLIGTSLPQWLQLNIFFLGDNAYFTAPIVRNLVKIGKIIPIDPSINLINTMRACAYVLGHNKVLCIFPEGGRSPDGSLQSFKKGVGILAHELDIPLVPVYIDGAFKALPRGKIFPNFNPIKIIFGEPCFPKQLKEKGMTMGATDNYEAIARGIQNEVNNLATKEYA